jgi:energy-coupling factor transporter ATP-binding protein EcfA2
VSVTVTHRFIQLLACIFYVVSYQTLHNLHHHVLSINLIITLSNTHTPQLRAVLASVSNDGFTLVQGPPGTGKTSTILGILNAFHIREYNRYYQLALDTFLGEDGQCCRRSKDIQPWLQLIAKVSRTKPHILTVAPSNIAVDNIIQRIMEDGFIDGKGGKYNPTLLRLGSGRGERVKAVTLEEVLESEQNKFKDVNARQLTNSALETQLAQLIQQIALVQGYLLNLRTAFSKHPLPEGWELRVSLETSQPYWVDHINRSASTVPPPPPPSHVSTLNYCIPTLNILPLYKYIECICFLFC